MLASTSQITALFPMFPLLTPPDDGSTVVLQNHKIPYWRALCDAAACEGISDPVS
jgi:hypothetical protein